MKTVPLHEVVDVAAGQAAPPPEAFEGSGIPFIRAGSGEGLMTRSNWGELEHISEETAKKRKLKLFPRDTVLFAKSGMSASLGRVHRIDRPAYVVSHLAALKPNGKADPSFLAHWLSYFGTHKLIKDPAYPSIRLADISGMPFPDVGKLEQKRIAAILDQADALRRLRRQSLSRLSDLGEAIFAEMFGSGSHTNHTALVPLSQVAQLINGDRSSNYPSGNDIVDAGVLFLSTRNILDGKVDLSFRQFITSEKFNSLGGGRLARDDVVITLRGTTGLSAVFNTEYETGFINAQLMIIRCGSSLLPQYLQRYLSLPATQHRMKRGGSGSAIPQLTGAQMKNFMILVPPIAQQRAFVDANADLQDHITDILASASKLDALFASLQQRAFRGEL